MATYEEILRRIRGAESSNNPLARAQTSSAGGLYQFTTDTMASVLKRMDPDTYGGKSKAELAKFKFDPNVSEQAAQFHLNRDILPKLERAGIPATPGSIYASWFLGPDGAVKTYQADPGARVADVTPYAVGPNSNIKFQGKKFGEWSASDLVNWAESKMGGSAPAAAAAQAPTGFGGQVANFLFGPPQPRSPDAFASDASPGLIAQATGGLIGGGRAEPFSVGFDTPRPYQPDFVKPDKQYGAAFAGSAPDMSGGSATLTSLPPTISAPAAGAAGIGSALASLGGALAKAGAAKEDMSWVQRPAETHRGKWDDEIFKRSIFGIRGLLG